MKQDLGYMYVSTFSVQGKIFSYEKCRISLFTKQIALHKSSL